MRKFKGNTPSVSRCIDGTLIMQDTVKSFHQKYQQVLDSRECQAHSVTTDPVFHRTNFSSASTDFDVFNKILDLGLNFDNVHTFHTKSSKHYSCILECDFFNKLVSHTSIPHSMHKGHIRLKVENISINRADSKNERPVMISTNFLRVL